jgi:hypothetical protein
MCADPTGSYAMHHLVIDKKEVYDMDCNLVLIYELRLCIKPLVAAQGDSICTAPAMRKPIPGPMEMEKLVSLKRWITTVLSW